MFLGLLNELVTDDAVGKLLPLVLVHLSVLGSDSSVHVGEDRFAHAHLRLNGREIADILVHRHKFTVSLAVVLRAGAAEHKDAQVKVVDEHAALHDANALRRLGAEPRHVGLVLRAEKPGVLHGVRGAHAVGREKLDSALAQNLVLVSHRLGVVWKPGWAFGRMTGPLRAFSHMPFGKDMVWKILGFHFIMGSRGCQKCLHGYFFPVLVQPVYTTVLHRGSIWFFQAGEFSR